MIGLIEVEAIYWKAHVDHLKNICIQIEEEDDVSVWSTNPSLGEYTPRLGYNTMFVDAN
jgi:hypothetical protein